MDRAKSVERRWPCQPITPAFFAHESLSSAPSAPGGGQNVTITESAGVAASTTARTSALMAGPPKRLRLHRRRLGQPLEGRDFIQHQYSRGTGSSPLAAVRSNGI